MTPDSRISVTTGDASTLTAAMSIGQILVPLVSVFIIDRFGKKKTILLAGLPMLVNWGMIMVAKNVVVLIVARIMAGFSMGLLLIVFPMYTGEIFSTNVRGALSTILLPSYYVGILFMFAVAPHLGVRVTAIVCFGFSLLFLICFWFVPESPYYLVMVGRVEEAECALEKLRGKTDVTEELQLIKATLDEKGKVLTEEGTAPRNQSTLRKILTTRANLKSLLIAIVLTTGIHLCGFPTIMGYCHIILEAMGSQLDVYVASLIFSILQVSSAAMCVLLVDKFGRRPLIIISGVTTGVLFMLIATYFFLMEYTTMDVKQYVIIPLASIFLVVATLNIGVMPVPNIILGEIFANDVKVLSSCIVGISGALMTTASNKSYLIIAKSWGLGHSVPFFGFAIMIFICSAILMRWLPETRGKSLLEIQEELNA